MGYWIDSTDTGRVYSSDHVVAYMCDTTADIESLPTSSSEGVKQGDDTVSYKPCAKGSSCLCLGSSELYILNSEDRWISV